MTCRRTALILAGLTFLLVADLIVYGEMIDRPGKPFPETWRN